MECSEGNDIRWIAIEMLNPDVVSALRSEIRQSPDVSQFRGYNIRRTALRPTSLNALKIFTLEPAQTGQMTGPARVFGEPDDPSCMSGISAGQLGTPAKILYVLTRARVIGNNFIIGELGDTCSPSPVVNMSDFDQVLTKNTNNHEGFVVERVNQEVRAYYAARPFDANIDQHALFLHNLEPGNYGSFLFRQLPQMLLLRDFPLDFDAYIVPDRTPWLREALRLVGLPDRPIFTVREITGDTFNSIAFFNEFDAEGFFSEEMAARLAGLARTVWVPGNPFPAQKVYVSRGLGTINRPDYRILINEESVEAQFQRHGFSIIYPEILSLSEQISIFRQAKFIAGPSGSGMLNAVFAEAGARILDLESFHYTVRQHAKIYSSTKKVYAFCFGAVDRNQARPFHLASWTLNKETLDVAIDWLLE